MLNMFKVYNYSLYIAMTSQNRIHLLRVVSNEGVVGGVSEEIGVEFVEVLAGATNLDQTKNHLVLLSG